MGGKASVTHKLETRRVLKIKLNGGSASANNYISHLGLYHFNGRGSTLELNDASNLEVGNTISIMESSPPIGSEYAYINYGEWRTGAKNGSETTDDYVGGWDHNYKITAIAGNVITLDRNIEAHSNKIYLSAKTGEGIDNFKNIIKIYFFKAFISIIFFQLLLNVA